MFNSKDAALAIPFPSRPLLQNSYTLPDRCIQYVYIRNKFVKLREHNED